MAKLKFGAWIATYAWSDVSRGAENMRRIHEAIRKCEEHGIDVWVIDHLLSAPGLYGNAWLEPLNTLAYAAALTSQGQDRDGYPGAPRPPSPWCLPRRSRRSVISPTTGTSSVWGPAGTRGNTRSPARASRSAAGAPTRSSRRSSFFSPRRTRAIVAATTSSRDVTIDPRPPQMPEMWVSGGSRVPDPDEHDVPVIAKTVMDRIVKAGNWLSRCSGDAGMGQARLGTAPGPCADDGARPENPHLRPLQLHPSRRDGEPGTGARGMPGALHTSDGHPSELGAPSRSATWPAASTGSTRASPTSLAPGLQYLVLGPVSDDPRQIDLLAQRVMPNFA